MDEPVFVAVNMKHHRASLWYRLRLQFTIFCFTYFFLAHCPQSNCIATRWDATGLSRGVFTLHAAGRRQRETPRGQPVASCEPMDQPVFVAVNMKHHRASLWYRLRLQFTIYALPIMLYLLFLGALPETSTLETSNLKPET